MAENPTLYGADGVTPVNRKTEKATSRNVDVWTAFDQRTGRSVVRLKFPGIEQIAELFPNESVLLGVKLIQSGEMAIGNATALRIMLEFGGFSLPEATQTLQAVSAGTRADHAVAHERLLKYLEEEAAKTDQQEQMAQPVGPEEPVN